MAIPSPGAVCPAMVMLLLMETAVLMLTVALAHRIAERTRTVIVQVRHVINAAATTTRDLRTKTQRLRESQRLGTCPDKTKHCQAKRRNRQSLM